VLFSDVQNMIENKYKFVESRSHRVGQMCKIRSTMHCLSSHADGGILCK